MRAAGYSLTSSSPWSAGLTCNADIRSRSNPDDEEVFRFGSAGGAVGFLGENLAVAFERMRAERNGEESEWQTSGQA